MVIIQAVVAAAAVLGVGGFDGGLKGGVEPLPVVRVVADDTVIDRSCRVEIGPGVVIRDEAGDGVIQIRASGITVEFAPGSVLRGAGAAGEGGEGVEPDGYGGVGVRIEGAKGVTVRGLVVSGYKVGVWATGADGLVVEGCRGEDLWRMRLRSTPVAEDAGDWLWPHKNDENEWLRNYGAALYVEDSEGVTVRGCVVRRGQNGLILDRVNGSKVYDNDFSFLSGWGVGMWRSSGNMVSRNALDFCVRGYSHGAYNRGQDSAGILMFEQCSDNVIAENSATHGGDGFFGFGGKEALGEVAAAGDGGEGFDCTRKGCNDNLLIGNDFSYAPAHGIEMTFSFGNEFVENRIVENAICGVWGGYSQFTHIVGNEFAGNGLPGRGEGGGINIEHGYRNLIEENTFRGNTVGVSLWWDNDEAILKTPWAKANYKGSSHNDIRVNTFEENTTDVRLRRTAHTILDYKATSRFRIDADEESANAIGVAGGTDLGRPRAEGLLGEMRPVGARAHLRGRDKIIMGEWGPWDHEGVLVRDGGSTGAARAVEVFGATGDVVVRTGSPGIVVSRERDEAVGMTRVTIAAERVGGVAPYAVTVGGDGIPGGEREFRGTLVGAGWSVRFYPWTVDPREDLAGWRAEEDGEQGVSVSLDGLTLRYGGGGPGSVAALRGMREKMPWRDRFGMVATATLELPKGRYRFTTLSDDGVRVVVRPGAGAGEGGRTVIENWTWHGPTRDVGEFEQAADGPVTITVEHFEIDGHAVLELGIEAVE